MAELSRGQILKNPEVISGTAGAGATVRLQDADKSAYIDIKTPDAVGAAYTLTLPADDGNSGDVLSTDGNGVLSFGGVPAAGSDTQITYNNAGTSAGAAVTTDNNNLYFGAGNGAIFEDSTENPLYSKIQHAAAADIEDANNLIYNLPTDTPSAGEVLKVASVSSSGGDTTATLNWATDETAAGATAAVGGDRAIQFSDAGVLGGDQNLTFQSDNTLEVVGNLFVGDKATPTDTTVGVATVTTRLAIGDVTDTTGENLVITTGDISGSPEAIKVSPTTGNANFDVTLLSSDDVELNATGTSVDLILSGARDVRLNPGTDNVIIENNRNLEFESSANRGSISFTGVSNNPTVTFPDANGASGEVLQSNASELVYVGNKKVVNACFSGGTSPVGISTVLVRIPCDCNIVEASIVQELPESVTDSVTIVVQRSTAIASPSYSTISNAFAVSAGVGLQDTTLTGWTVGLTEGDLLRFQVTVEPATARDITASLVLLPT